MLSRHATFSVIEWYIKLVWQNIQMSFYSNALPVMELHEVNTISKHRNKFFEICQFCLYKIYLKIKTNFYPANAIIKTLEWSVKHVPSEQQTLQESKWNLFTVNNLIRKDSNVVFAIKFIRVSYFFLASYDFQNVFNVAKSSRGMFRSLWKIYNQTFWQNT